MGLCFSCCRRRQRQSAEHQHLLPSDPVSNVPPPASNLEKGVDILAALNAGKLPSQDQLSHILRASLKSSALSGEEYSNGPLSKSGKQVVRHLREVLEAVLQIGMEKNEDDLFQDLMYRMSRTESTPVLSEVRVDSNLTEAPTSQELQSDSAELITSLKSICTLLLTSSAFRRLLSSLLLTSRELLASLATDIEDVAETVQAGADHVQRAAKLGDLNLVFEELSTATKEVAEDTEIVKEQWTGPVNENVHLNNAKDVVISRIQEVILHSHKNPKHRKALQTILLIFRKYTRKLSKASTNATGTVSVTIDSHFDRLMGDIKVVLERLASGRSLDPFLKTFFSLITDIINSPLEASRELRDWISRVGLWLDVALNEPQFITSQRGIKEMERLYDQFPSSVDAPWAQDLQRLSTEASHFISALETDRSTTRLIRSLDELSSSMSDFTRDAVTSASLRQELVQDVIGWFIPMLLKTLRAIPMPRVEFKNNTVDVALDALLLTAGTGVATSFVPDEVKIQNWNEVRVNMVPRQSSPEVETTTRTHIHIAGLRLALHDIAYYFAYKGLPGPFSYSDEGLVSVDMGSRVGEGVTVDLEVEVDRGDEKLFSVMNVKTMIPGLVFGIARSKHYILNTLLLEPLSGPIVRTLLRRLLDERIRSGLEGLEEALRRVKAEAEAEDGDGGLGGWFTAILSLFGGRRDGATEDSHTKANLTGLVHTTVAQQEPHTSDPPTPEETVVAVGMGAQVFPGKGGPYGEDGSEGTWVDVAREAVDGGVGKTRELVDGALYAREQMERAEERRQEQVDFERKRKEWRSSAFDL